MPSLTGDRPRFRELGICGVCRRRDPDGAACQAFPGGIPLEILVGDVDHRQPYPGDGGYRFVGQPFPTTSRPVHAATLRVLEDQALRPVGALWTDRVDAEGFEPAPGVDPELTADAVRRVRLAWQATAGDDPPPLVVEQVIAYMRDDGPHGLVYALGRTVRYATLGALREALTRLPRAPQRR